MLTGLPLPRAAELRSNVSTVSMLAPEYLAGRLTDVHGTVPVTDSAPLVSL